MPHKIQKVQECDPAEKSGAGSNEDSMKNPNAGNQKKIAQDSNKFISFTYNQAGTFLL